MTKDQLLSLWNADNWEVMSCGVYFTAHRADADKELHINCNDYTEAEILAMPFWERLAQELDELDRQAHEILQKEFPDDEDIPGLALTDITICPSAHCRRTAQRGSGVSAVTDSMEIPIQSADGSGGRTSQLLVRRR